MFKFLSVLVMSQIYKNKELPLGYMKWLLPPHKYDSCMRGHTINYSISWLLLTLNFKLVASEAQRRKYLGQR